MAEYKGIKGFKVQYLSADPSDPIIGQTWYNSTSKDLKYTEFAAASWASGGNVSTARYALAGAGTQTAALAFGGDIPPGFQLPQKNIMVLLGQMVELWQQEDIYNEVRNSNGRVSFWWYWWRSYISKF
jgi:hypothetical protein